MRRSCANAGRIRNFARASLFGEGLRGGIGVTYYLQLGVRECERVLRTILETSATILPREFHVLRAPRMHEARLRGLFANRVGLLPGGADDAHLADLGQFLQHFQDPSAAECGSSTAGELFQNSNVGKQLHDPLSKSSLKRASLRFPDNS